MSKNKKEFLVKDLIIDDEYGVIDSKATILEAAKQMKDIGIPDLVVTEKDNKVLGIIGDFDIVQKIAEGVDCKSEKVVNVMYIIEPVQFNTPVKEAFTRMQELRVNVIPVVEEGKLKGVCSIQDCWSYIPDETFDDIGLIPVENTKIVEFWFASICSIMALLFGVIFPLIGIYGFFYTDQANLLGFLGIVDIRLGTTDIGGSFIRFYLFEARGADFLIPYSSLISKNGIIWLFIDIISIISVIFGILSLFTIIYASYSDAKKILAGRYLRVLIPGLFIMLLILEWIIFIIAFSISLPTLTISIDLLGMSFSVVSIILVLLAIFRDYIFRGKEVISNKNAGGE